MENAFSLGGGSMRDCTVSHTFLFRVGQFVRFKEHKARSQKTRVPVLVPQLTTNCKYFISWSLESPIYQMKIISLLLHRVILVITNKTEGKAREGHRKPIEKLPFMKSNTRFLDELLQAKQQNKQTQRKRKPQ